MVHVLFERIAVPAFLLVNGYGSRLNKILMCCAMNVFIGLHSNILVTILDLDVALFSNLVVYTVYKDEIIYDKSLSICSCSVVKRCSLFSFLMTTCANVDLLNLLFSSICSIQHLYVFV